MDLTRRWSERPPALRSRFAWLKPFRLERHSLPVAVAQLVLVRCVRAAAKGAVRNATELGYVSNSQAPS